MSAEVEVTDALQQPVDQNAQSAEDVKKMLAELDGEAGVKKESDSKDTVDTQETSEPKENGTSTDAKEEPVSVKNEDADSKEDNRDRSPDQRRGDRGDRFDRGGRGRGRGRGGRGSYGSRPYRDNIKSDVTTQEESDDPVAIRRQVEFYFSDSNLPRDKFLLQQVGGSKNNPVELKILHTFKRMRHFQPFEAIVEAMKVSTFLELCEDDTCVRRRDPLPASLDNGPDPNAIEIFEDRAAPRSVYAKGFGEEKPSTQFDIEHFFAEYGTTNAVRLRRTDDKVFKGSVFVEFDSEEAAQKFLELDPKPQYHGRDLQIMSKRDYTHKKVEDIKAGRIKPNKPHHKPRRDDRYGGRDHKRKRDDEDDRDWRIRREEDRKSGYRGDKRRSRDDPDYTKGGKPGAKPKYEKAELDDKGIPVVKDTTEADSKAKRDAAKAEALAKAKAIVEAQNKGEEQKAVDEVETTEQNGEGANKEAVEAVAESITADAEATTGKKRAREDDEGDAEREVKKVDSKTEVEVES